MDPTSSMETAGAGVVVLDARGRLVLRNRAAAAQIEDLAGPGLRAGAVPEVIRTAAGLPPTRRGSARAETGGTPEEGPIRALGRSGARYTLRASPSEPDAQGRSFIIVTIEAAPRRVGPGLPRIYGLSPREREVVALAARGESTKAVAARLGLSPYTVQEHLGKACEKVGVRGRRALLARLFYEG